MTQPLERPRTAQMSLASSKLLETTLLPSSLKSDLKFVHSFVSFLGLVCLFVVTVNRMPSKPTPLCTWFSFTKFWHYYIYELVVLIPVILFAIFITRAPITFEPIIERDPTISYALVTATVPTTMLILISILVPLAIFILGDLLRLFYYKKPSIEFAYAFLGECLMLGWSILLTFAITNVIKIYAGYPRPNFFAYCNYQGYRTALASGNFTSYNALTTPGNFASLLNCQASPADIQDSHS